MSHFCVAGSATEVQPGAAGGALTYEGVEGRVGADAAHLVHRLEGQDVLLVLRAAQRAAGAAAGAEVPRGECCRAASWPDATGTGQHGHWMPLPVPQLAASDWNLGFAPHPDPACS